MELTIRTAELNDAALLREMGYASYLAHFAPLWHSEQEMNAFLEGEYALAAIERSLSGDNERWLIAETNRPVGFAKVSWKKHIPGEAISGALLNKLYFVAGETGKHFGQQLLDAVIHSARLQGEDYFWLEVLDQNIRARKFYEFNGLMPVKQSLFCSATQTSTIHFLGMPI